MHVGSEVARFFVYGVMKCLLPLQNVQQIMRLIEARQLATQNLTPGSDMLPSLIVECSLVLSLVLQTTRLFRIGQFYTAQTSRALCALVTN